MASTSAQRAHGVGNAIKTAASSISADSQTILADIRKFLPTLRDVAVDMEKENDTDKVKQLEEAMIEFLKTSEDCARFSSALVSIGNTYQPTEQATDFEKLLEQEMEKLGSSSSLPQNSTFLFFTPVQGICLDLSIDKSTWHLKLDNVHHGGQPMPGDEQEDIVMTGTQTNLLNTTCPLSGKPIIQLAEPVRCVKCKHIYEKEAIMRYISAKGANARCPVAACPRVLTPSKVLCDPLLLIEIEEMRNSMTDETDRTIEDFTAIDEED